MKFTRDASDMKRTESALMTEASIQHWSVALWCTNMSPRSAVELWDDFSLILRDS